MAVPKKKSSKSRKHFRRSKWIKKISKQIQQAYSLGNSILNDKKNSFIYDKSLDIIKM